MRFQPFPMRVTDVAPAVLAFMLAVPGLASAQDVVPGRGGGQFRVFAPDSLALRAVDLAAPAAGDEKRACPGCPKRRPLWAVGEVIGINLLSEGVNLAFKPADEKIHYRTYPKLWWNNISHGFEWDDNTFMINQWGHPYQGSAYFSAGRSNGLSFWESVPLTALGAMTWEYLAERHNPSMNDLLMTTFGGITLGEMFHRSAWLIRDTTDTGGSRLTREIVAAVLDPVTGINRFIDRDALRVVEKPASLIPSAFAAAFDTGLLWRGENVSFREASGEPFLQANVAYGTPSRGRSTVPFDAFYVNVRFGGGGSAISEVRGRGRLTGTPLGGKPGADSRHSLHFASLIGYDYDNNSAYQFGGQEIAGAFTSDWRLAPTWRLVTTVSGGFLALGAIDSIYDSGKERDYDFGPGLSYGGSVALMREGHPFLRGNYSAVWLRSVDGARADHWTQNVRVDLLLPIKGRLGLGTAGEFIRRRSYYDEAEDVLQRFPQVRMYLSWMY